MIKETTIKKEVLKIEEVVISEDIYCDQCGKLILSNNKQDTSLNKRAVQFYELSTYHSDWANDSIDSVKNFDLCCPICVQIMIDKYFKETEGERNSMRFELRNITEDSM